MFLPLLALLAFAGCADPTKDKAAAVITDVPAAPPVSPAASTAAGSTPAAPAPAGAWVAATGTVGFHAAKVTKTHDAVFGQSSFSVQLAGAEVTGVKVDVAVGSVKTDSAKLDTHLLTGDFFDVANLPTATFQSTEIRAGAPSGTALEGATHTVAGDLTIHGVTRHIEIPAVIKHEGAGIVGTTEFGIHRQDFGITYPGKTDDLIADGVLIRAQFVI